MKLELRSDRLRLFDAVVRLGGFSAAARALKLTQSSVSQSIAALGATETLATHVLPIVFGHFRDSYPDVSSMK